MAAFDVQAVCSGFVYGCATAAGLIAAGIAERVLLVATEAITGFIDPEDRNTAVIFGDGAGAVVLRAGDPDEPGALGAFDLGSDGANSDLIAVGTGGSRVPPRAREPHRADDFLFMDGREVYRRAIPAMVTSSRKVLASRGWETEDVDLLIGHQANERILVAVGERLDLPRGALPGRDRPRRQHGRGDHPARDGRCPRRRLAAGRPQGPADRVRRRPDLGVHDPGVAGAAGRLGSAPRPVSPLPSVP